MSPFWLRSATLSLLLMPCFHVGLSQDITTQLMQSTFRISGPSRGTPGEVSYGSGFIIGRPVAGNASLGAFVLVTAAHVLEDIQGDIATLVLRKQNDDGTFKELSTTFHIRNRFRELYYVHPEADVATAYVYIPGGLPPVLPSALLVTDAALLGINLHPGDELLTLGFPLYSMLNTFPVVRSGILASYPITPMKQVRTFYLNFRVFRGNSGGPVYFNYTTRTLASGGTVVGRYQGIVGLVSGQLSSTASGEDQSLDIATVVPSAYIAEAIDALGEQGTSPYNMGTAIPRKSALSNSKQGN